MVFSSDQIVVASAGSDAMVHLWDLRTGKVLGTLTGHTAVIQCLAISPDGKMLASGSSDKTTRIWDVASGQMKMLLKQPVENSAASGSLGMPGMVFAVSYSPDGTLLATGGGDGAGKYGELDLWNLKTGTLRQTLLGIGEEEVWAVAFTPDGERLVSGHVNGTVKVFDVKTGMEVAQMKAGDNLRSMAISPDGRTLATGTHQSIKLWDLASRERKGGFESPEDNLVSSLAFSADGKWLASAGRRVRLWEIRLTR